MGMCAAPSYRIVFVNLVGDGQHVELTAQPAIWPQFPGAEHFARRIIRRIQDDGFSCVGECAAQFDGIERPIRARNRTTRLSAPASSASGR
jgi:hypothetical protein